MLELQDITGGYGSVPIVQNISFNVEAGEIFSIVGPNGSGKSTLLKFIFGALEPDQGKIFIDHKPLSTYAPKALAKKVAVLPQHAETTFSFTVRQVVELGRYPYQKGLFSTQLEEDTKIVDQSMEETGVLSFADQPLDTLSGGERQRVFLARALAQEPDMLLLDEPTNHLDISFQISLLDTLKKWARTKKLTVVAVLHDLNMAAMYSDRTLLLKEGRQEALGKPAYVMEKNSLESVYKTELYRKEHPSVPSPLITLVPHTEKDVAENYIDGLLVTEETSHTCISSSIYWKTLSSAVIGAGFGWHRHFVNRHVDKNYNEDNPESEYMMFLQSLQIDSQDTTGMMTAASLADGAKVRVQDEDGDVFVYATAGTANAVDVSKAYEKHSQPVTIGTINIWIFIDGTLTEAAYTQVMMTATEAKAKALLDKDILDPDTGTPATGTSTDSMCVAATQQGDTYHYGGTISVLGKKIGKAVYEAVAETLDRYKERRRSYSQA
ncbi:heme ABC transporter ATP-binding protein [Bacillus piscicola]|uniref:heme ABC transporter ATP-binding protein n=1 Tax=Bacillus piscicola TaxID=1632684 RepID=UPI001F09C2B9|nr:heme ABC transporter ATP-binding protein [Bacillus piscicola]